LLTDLHAYSEVFATEPEFLSLAFPQEVYKVVNTKKESQWAF